MKPEKYVLSLSGGKDSTAMLLRLLEEKRPVDLSSFAIRGLNFHRCTSILPGWRHISADPLSG